MSVKIYDVEKTSKCARKGIKTGDELISVNGNDINDVLDYRFYTDDDKLSMLFRTAEGKEKKVIFRHNTDCDSIGLSFETYLMDKHRRCRNACIFCFIDQLPKGMRESLYFKDDDSRLSFLFGNYITLTNLSEHDVDRIIRMHISPINASVHTMNPELRVEMMKNPSAGTSLGLLRRFSDAGIRINAQLVLCPGINDGKELKYSLDALAELESVGSIAAVPVGLTKYREGLYELRSFDKDSAKAVIDVIDEFNDSLHKQGRDTLAYASDEFYQLSETPFPDYDYYGDFPQLDNGVGLYVSLKKEFCDIADDYEGDNSVRSLAIATGEAAYPVIREIAEYFCSKNNGTDIKVYCIKNEFFGHSVTVAGLITGRDLISSLKNQGFSCEKLILPSVMFKSKDELIFLDDVSKEDVEKELDTKVVIADCDAGSLFDVILEN